MSPSEQQPQQTTDELLEERGKTHGEFVNHAHFSQNLKSWTLEGQRFRAQKELPTLSSVQLEALSMIQHKIARILTGDCNHKDHWDDIAGYAKLATKGLSD